MSLVIVLFAVVLAIALALTVANLATTVIKQQTIGIVETFGKYSGSLQPGLHFILPLVQSVVARVSLQVRELRENIEVKTKDNMFVKVPVALMTKVRPEGAEKSHYLLTGIDTKDYSEDQHQQVASWVLNTLRSSAAGLTLEELFADRERLSREVKDALDAKMAEYGFEIVAVLIDQPQVSLEVQTAFNRVVASKREREAAEQEAEQEAEAKRIRIVGEARAESEAQSLRAQGVAAARAILATSMTSAMESANVKGLDGREVLALLLETNRLDTIRAASEHGKLVIMDVRNPMPLTLDARS